MLSQILCKCAQNEISPNMFSKAYLVVSGHRILVNTKDSLHKSACQQELTEYLQSIPTCWVLYKWDSNI